MKNLLLGDIQFGGSTNMPYMPIYEKPEWIPRLIDNDQQPTLIGYITPYSKQKIIISQNEFGIPIYIPEEAGIADFLKAKRPDHMDPHRWNLAKFNMMRAFVKSLLFEFAAKKDYRVYNDFYGSCSEIDIGEVLYGPYDIMDKFAAECLKWISKNK